MRFCPSVLCLTLLASAIAAPGARLASRKALSPLLRRNFKRTTLARAGNSKNQNTVPRLQKLREAWGAAAAQAAFGLMVAAGSLSAGGVLPAFAAGENGKALAEQINMDALKAMTKDAIDKGYDQEWIDDHLSQMEARGYDIDWVQKHLGSVMDEVKQKAEIDPKNMMFKNLDQGKAPEKLEGERVVSSIPRTTTDGLPSHQEGFEGINTWVYPSPKMFWNAMDRKGKHPERYNPEDISGVVRIHNFVNEKGPTLTSFKGKYDQLSGKGFLNKYIPGMLGAPFDRHDWVVNRCGKTVRYVLDYYKDPNLDIEPKIRLDVRPAPDSIENLEDWIAYPSFSSKVSRSEVSFEQTTKMKTADEVMRNVAEAK
ncbi:hypothetical protein AAMO2058_001511600 [Amorphochlora amoebiformis]